MRHHWGLSLLGSVVLLCAPQAQQPAPSDKPAFRTGVDVVQIDVSVLDDQRRPVRGLTAADFSVIEDGVRRPIVAFSAIELPAAPNAAPVGLASIAPDVTTNDAPEGRLVVILLDQSTRLGRPVVLARQLASAAVDALAPGDLAAVIHTNQGLPQNFTTDRARLRRAIERGRLGMNPPETDLGRGECPCGVCSLDAVTTVADALRGAPQRRKSLLFIGESIALDPYQRSPQCTSMLTIARERLLRATQASHLTVHALDPNGLETTSVSADVIVKDVKDAALKEQGNRAGVMNRHGSLREFADLTGGRAVLNTNAPTDHIRNILDESSAYYVVGFEASASRDNRFRPISVHVARKNVEVHSRKGYYRGDNSAAEATSTAPLSELVRRVLPEKSLPLTIAPAAFAVAGQRTAAVLLPLGVRAASPAAPSTESPSESEQVEVYAAAFRDGGGDAPWSRHRFEITVMERSPGELQYEFVPRLDLSPGRYEIRTGVRHGRTGVSGTVYAYVDVPDFEREPVTLSGIVLSDPAAPLAARDETLGALLPHAPTTRRRFAGHDDVRAMVRVYQNRRDAPQPVTIDWRVVDSSGRRVAGRVDRLTADGFGDDRSLDADFELPLATLAAGEYALTVEATRGASTVRRDVRFSVQ